MPTLPLPALAATFVLLDATAYVQFETAKLAVYVMFVCGAVIECGLFVLPSLQLANNQPLEGVAVNTTGLPNAAKPPPVTVPPATGFAATLIVICSVKANAVPRPGPPPLRVIP